MTAVGRSRLRPGDAVRVGTVGLRARRGRTALTALGIAIGIAAMVAVLGISASSRADLLAELDALGTDLLQVSAGQSFFGEASELPEASTEMVRRIGPVQQASAMRNVGVNVRRTDMIPDSETGGISVLATDLDLLDTLEAPVATGTFLNEATAQYPAVVLGAVAAERLGIDSLDGSPQVYLGGHWFTVVGVLDEVPLSPDIDRSALIGFDVAASLFDTDRAPQTIYVRTDPDNVDAVRNVLPATVNPEAPNEVTVTRPSDALEARAAADKALTALLIGLGAVALLVGGVGIANVMIISVLERRAEIGVRRALGATRGHIRVQFVLEALALAALGGLAGIGLGAVITVVYARGREWTVDVPVAGLTAGIAAALAIGALAGLYPAVRAARMAPSEAVRTA